MEEWRDIPSYEGLYQVSNLGRVRSLDRVVTHKKNGFSRLKGKVLKPYSDGKRYLNVKLCKKTIKVHKLVAITFLNHTPNGHIKVIDHINGDSLDNRVENLQIITNRKNCIKDRSGHSSIYDGVSWRKIDKKWDARIWNKKQVYLGLWKNELRAAAEVLRYKEKHNLL